MGPDSFLVIDAGSGSVKSFLVSTEGEILKRTEREWDRQNWNSETGWRKITESISHLLNQSDTRILGLSCTSMREEFVLVDEQGIELTYKLSPDSEKYGYKLLDKYGKSMYLSSGHWPVPNWIAGGILPWLYDTMPNFSNKISKILMICDWINYKISGEYATDGTSACETSLYNLKKREWDWTIIDKLSLPKSIFPKVMRSGDEIGRVNVETSKLTGLPVGIPILIGGADTQCGLLGMGTLTGEIAAVGGTTTPLQVVTDSPIFDERMRTWTNTYLIEGKWTLESNVGYTGRGVRWIRNRLCNPDISYDEINAGAEKISPGSNGLLTYLGPHLFDSGPPYWPMDKLGNMPIEPTILGLYDFDIPILTRSVFEANSYGVKANLDQLAEISELEFNFLKFCGGNSKSSTWMQIQADVLNLPIHVPKVHDASSVGAAILSSIGTGYYSDFEDAVSNMVKLGNIYNPRNEYMEKYKKYYRTWTENRDRLGKINRSDFYSI